jgi:uncharacterized protein (DUF58 family)
MAGPPILERSTLEKLERLTLRWRKSFRGLVGGHNRSRYAGPGQEFLDHRSFHQGDDLRAVNWRAYLRLEKLFLKMFQVEPRTPIRVMLDASASMTAPAPAKGAAAKFDFARQLAAAIVYVGLVRHDALVIQPFHSGLDDPHLASGGRHRFGPVSDYLMALQPGGKTHYFDAARQFLAEYAKQGLLIIISDFLDDDDCLRPLQYLGEFGHELMLLQVYDPAEREPVWDGDLDLEDAETGQHFELSLNAEARRAYTAAFDRHSAALDQLAQRHGGRFVALSTGTPIEEAIFYSIDHAGAALERAGREF